MAWAGLALSAGQLVVGVDRDRSAFGVAAIHRTGRESPGAFAVRCDGNQSAQAAQFLDVLKRAVERLLQRLSRKADPFAQLVAGDRTDEILARTSRRNGCRAIVGKGARA